MEAIAGRVVIAFFLCGIFSFSTSVAMAILGQWIPAIYFALMFIGCALVVYK